MVVMLCLCTAIVKTTAIILTSQQPLFEEVGPTADDNHVEEGNKDPASGWIFILEVTTKIWPNKTFCTQLLEINSDYRNLPVW